jgi:predicted Zn-dependent peptidase
VSFCKEKNMVMEERRMRVESEPVGRLLEEFLATCYLAHPYGTQIGGGMDDPDYFALVVMNRILGGGFTGRLFKNVRGRAGLAYSVFGRYSASYTHPGLARPNLAVLLRRSPSLDLA